MPTIRAEVAIAADAASVWDAVRDVGAAHRRLVPGLVTDVRLEGAVRVVTFAGGFTVRERIIDIDDAARRLAYSATGGRAEHHNAAMEVLADGPGRCRLRWITDVLPAEAVPPIRALVEQGAALMQRTLEAG